MVSATTIATANPKKIIENKNKDMDIEKGNEEEETHTHKDCFGEDTIKMKPIYIFTLMTIFICYGLVAASIGNLIRMRLA